MSKYTRLPESCNQRAHTGGERYRQKMENIRALPLFDSKAWVLACAAIMHRMTGDPVEVTGESKPYHLTRWTGSEWVRG